MRHIHKRTETQTTREQRRVTQRDTDIDIRNVTQTKIHSVRGVDRCRQRETHTERHSETGPQRQTDRDRDRDKQISGMNE